MEIKNSCCNCQFSYGYRGEIYRFRDDLLCRRHAPVQVGTSERPYTQFPVVSGDTWCGDYEPDMKIFKADQIQLKEGSDADR